MCNLAIDIGNTRVKAAVFNSNGLVCKEIWEDVTVGAIEKLAYNHKVKNAILSSTAKIPGEIERWLAEKYTYFQLATNTPLPFELRYDTPETLGKDRIAAAAGAIHFFPGKNSLVIDAGTCITMDIVNEEGQFLGGNISPGIEMRLKAMKHYTDKLPMVTPRGKRLLPENLLGKSTEEAILNGGELGALLEVTAFMEKCRRRYERLQVLFTGGNADFFVKNIKTKIFANSNLVLIGLNKILEHNVENYFQGKR